MAIPKYFTNIMKLVKKKTVEKMETENVTSPNYTLNYLV